MTLYASSGRALYVLRNTQIVRVDAGGRVSAAFTALRAGIRSASTTNKKIVVAGSSSEAGEKATTEANRWVNRVAYGWQSTVGSLGYTPIASPDAAFGTLRTENGLHFYNMGQSGADSGSYITNTEAATVGAMPNLLAVIHKPTSNDYRDDINPVTTKANIKDKISRINTAAGGSGPIHVLINAYAPTDSATTTSPYPPSAYATLMREIVAEDPAKRIFIDVADNFILLGTPANDPNNLWDADQIHMSDAGHAKFAEFIAAEVGIALGTGATVVAPPVPSNPAPTGAITDTFTRADGVLLGSTTTTGSRTWAEYGAGGARVLTNAVTGPATGTSITIPWVNTAGADMKVSARLSTAPATASVARGGIAFRVQDASNYLYLSMRTSGTNADIALFKTVAGTSTQVVGSSSSSTTSANALFEISAVGTSVKVTRNGTSIINTTVTELATATGAGFFLVGGMTPAFDDFSATGLPADNFDTAGNLGGAALSSGTGTWTLMYSSSGTVAPVSDIVKASGVVGTKAGGVTNTPFAYTPMFATTYTVETTIAAIDAAASARGGGIAARIATNGSGFFFNTRVNSTTQGYALYRQPNGSTSTITTVQSTTVIPTVGDRLRLEVTPTTIAAYVNGVLIGTLTDSLNGTVENAGLFWNTSATGNKYDNFARTV